MPGGLDPAIVERASGDLLGGSRAVDGPLAHADPWTAVVGVLGALSTAQKGTRGRVDRSMCGVRRGLSPRLIVVNHSLEESVASMPEGRLILPRGSSTSAHDVAPA